MKNVYDPQVRKHPVNLTLNEDLVSQTKSMTDNLSGVVETLLADFVANEKKQRAAKARALKTAVAGWNEFNARRGSFADDHSTL